MVLVIVHHTYKDFNVFSSRAWDWGATLKPDKGYKYIKTYCAVPLKNEPPFHYIPKKKSED